MPESDTVTALKPTQRDPTRVMVRLGKRVAATLPREVVADLDIEVGTPWTENLAARIAEAVDFDKALRYCLNALGRRALSSGELVDRMRRRGHGGDVADAVVERLRERRLIDDRAYGESVIRAERARKPVASRFLRAKLRQKRLPAELVDELVRESEGGQDDVAEARKLAEARLRSPTLRKAEAQARRRRLWGILARRGFDSDVIRQALAGLLDEDEA